MKKISILDVLQSHLSGREEWLGTCKKNSYESYRKQKIEPDHLSFYMLYISCHNIQQYMCDIICKVPGAQMFFFLITHSLYMKTVILPYIVMGCLI